MDMVMEVNKIIQGDCLEVMKGIPDNYIDLIYLDILYGTGRNFKDYEDLKADRKIIDDFYIPRIKEMYRILKDTGSIYLQMDWRINHWIRLILDDVFGYKHFRNEVIWSKGFNGTASNEFFQKTHDNIYFYTKTNNYCWNNVYQKHKKNYMERKNKKDKKGFYQEVKRYNKDRSFYYGKVYAQPKKCDDVFEDIRLLPSNANERINYDTQKPEALLERIVLASSNENDLIADFFCGSGTTCVVAKKLNRDYIGCDISEKACEIARRRIKAIPETLF